MPDRDAEELRHFKARTAGSRRELERARRLLPSGVCSNFRLMDPNSIFLRRARGSRVEDVDGNEYVDYGLAQSALLTGHAHPAVLEAVHRQMARGTLLCYPNPLTADLADVIRERFRLEQMRFVNTGAEATQFAVRVARAATGRDGILKFDICYHGSASEFWIGRADADLPAGAPDWMGQEVHSAGIPRDFFRHTVVARYNDLEDVRACFRDRESTIAAVIVEPIAFNLGICQPREGFLEGLRRICDREGALLIYDEVKMGCKLGPKGAGEHFGVPADLVCMAKSIGGGFPIGLFGGRRDLMRTIEAGGVKHVGTYAANPVGLAAAYATLTEVLTPESYRRLFALNRALADGYRDAIERAGLDAHVVTAGASGCLFLGRAPVRDRFDFARTRLGLWPRFWVGMCNRGVLPQAYGPEDIWTVSVQHTDEDIETTVRAFREVAPALA
jgi:glutamate-1-semialdehyde 2,1-aminomutase